MRLSHLLSDCFLEVSQVELELSHGLVFWPGTKIEFLRPDNTSDNKVVGRQTKDNGNNQLAVTGSDINSTL